MMKYNKILSAIAGVLVLGAYSCSEEWDDHYASTDLGNGNGTLWSVISSEPDMSNFMAVLAATGYDAALSSSQVFTIFAPTDENFTAAERDELIERYKADPLKGDKNRVIKEFVQNHIALYNHSVSDYSRDTTLYMMNGKHLSFTKSAFAGHDFQQRNIPASNGLLFSISSKAEFKPNIYEYIQKDEELDSVWQFLKHYHIEKFVPEKSVPGEIVNGKTEYLDSVTETKNKVLTEWLEARLDSEDSLYWAVLPTNQEWKRLLEKNEAYFQYSQNVPERDSLMYVYPRLAILQGMQFSHTKNPNLGLTENIDSVVSTLAVPYNMREYVYGSYDKKYYQFDNPYDNIFNKTKNVECSNGQVMKSSTWNVDPLLTSFKEIVMEGENRNSIDSLMGPAKSKPIYAYVQVPTDSYFYGKVSGNSYYMLSPSSANNPAALFRLNNVLSNVPYDIYLVTAPNLLTENPLPTKFSCKIVFHDMNDKDSSVPEGKEESYTITNAAIPALKKAANDNDYDPKAIQIGPIVLGAFHASHADVDEVKLGTFTFPTASYGLDKTQVKLLIQVEATAAEVRAGTASNSIMIDCIKLVPHVEE